MSNEKIIISDKMLEAKLKEKSNILNISLDELINRYINQPNNHAQKLKEFSMKMLF